MQLALIVYFLGLLPTALWLDCCRCLVQGERAGINSVAIVVCVAWPLVIPATVGMAQVKEWIDGN